MGQVFPGKANRHSPGKKYPGREESKSNETSNKVITKKREKSWGQIMIMGTGN
jgi:hypothetical protein